jgi:hypothetical protein
LSAIAQGLGAAGASLGHTQNFATQIVQSAVQRDMNAQEKAYDSGLQTRNTAFARFMDIYKGNREMARSAVIQAGNKIAQSETDRLAAQSHSEDVGAQAKVQSAQFQQAQLLEEQKRQELAQGTQTITSEDKFHQASGGAGAAKHLTLEQELALAKAQTDAKNKGLKDQGALGLTPQALARQKRNYNTDLQPLANFADSLSHRATLMGIHFDPKTGELTNAAGKPAKDEDIVNPIGSGPIGKHFRSDVTTPKAMELKRAEENSVRLHAAMVYNHSISAEEGAKEAENTIGNTNAAKLANMRYLAEEYRKRKVSMDSGAAAISPVIVNDRDQAEKAVNFARATGAPLPGPTPELANPSGTDTDSGGDQ